MNSNRFDGHVVLVTGAARGLGLGIATRFAEEGATVWMADIDPLVIEVAAELGASASVSDVSSSRQVDALVETILARDGRLDVAVANAGIGGGGSLLDMTDETFRGIVQVNLEGVFFTARASARVMVKQNRGVIVTTGSVFGRDTPAGSSAYGATKAGVQAMTHAWARELATSGVRVNCVSPGHMGTEMYWNALQRRAARTGRSYEQTRDDELKAVPMGRFGTGNDVAGLVTFLASEDASYITGQTINVDGGLQPR